MLPFPVLLSVGVFSFRFSFSFFSFFFWGKKIILGVLQSAIFFTLYSFIMPELFIRLSLTVFLWKTQLWKEKRKKIKLPEYSSSKLLLNVVVILALKCEEQIV